jgi:hypothetical protein
MRRMRSQQQRQDVTRADRGEKGGLRSEFVAHFDDFLLVVTLLPLQLQSRKRSSDYGLFTFSRPPEEFPPCLFLQFARSGFRPLPLLSPPLEFTLSLRSESVRAAKGGLRRESSTSLGREKCRSVRSESSAAARRKENQRRLQQRFNDYSFLPPTSPFSGGEAVRRTLGAEEGMPQNREPFLFLRK